MDNISFMKENCVLRSASGKTLVNSKGSSLTWALDLRIALLNSDRLNSIAKKFWDLYEGLDFQLAAIELAGIPLVSALILESKNRGYPTDALIIRTKRKKYLGNKIIEGVPSGKPVVLVDDAVNSGKNAELARKKLEAEGLNVIGLFVIVDFRSKSGIKWRFKNKIEVTSLYQLDDFGLAYSRVHEPNHDYKTIWSFASPRPNLGFAVAKSTPVLFEDKVIFGSDAGIMWCVQKDTGRIEWQFSIQDRTKKGIICSPIIHEGRLYFGGYDGFLRCLDPKTGKEIWGKKLCDWIGSSPVITTDRIYIGLEYRTKGKGGCIACLDLDGNFIWHKPVEKPLHSSPIIHKYNNKDYLITGTNDCDLFTLHTRTGEVISHVKCGGPIKYHCAAWEDRAVACAFDAIYVWNYLTGEVLLKFNTDDINYSRPLIVNGIAFCGSADGNLYMIDMATASVVGEMDVGEKIHSSPAFIDGAVWFGTSAGELIAIDPVNFEVLHRLAFPERLTCTLVSDGNLMYVYAYDNRMWAIKVE